MNLQQMRDLVRTQLDLDDTDLPDILLDAFIQQGYDLAVGLENRWPFFQMQWPVTADVTGIIAMPPDVGHVEMVATPDGRVLMRQPVRWAYQMVGPATTGVPLYWTDSPSQIIVSPKPLAGTAYTLLGFRKGADWIGGGASTECDCDRRLHIPICWYACSLGYAQQEDEVLEATYLNRYHETVGEARQAIMRPWPGQPRQFSSRHWPTAFDYGGRDGIPQVIINTPGP